MVVHDSYVVITGVSRVRDDTDAEDDTYDDTGILYVIITHAEARIGELFGACNDGKDFRCFSVERYRRSNDVRPS